MDYSPAAPDKATTLALQSSASSAVYGQTITLTATVGATASIFTPTGTVTFKDGANVLGTATLASNGVATLSVATLAVGNHSISAVYSGDAVFTGSTSGTVKPQVKQAATQIALASSAATAAYGSTVTFIVTVSPVAPGAGMPTGSVTFMDGNVVLATVNLVNGVADFPTAALSTGKHNITALYSGDPDFAVVTSQVLTETIL